MIRKIPIIFRAPIALLCDAAIYFGPILLGLYFSPDRLVSGVIIILGIGWIAICHLFLLWRLDVFWNLKSKQNKTDKPPFPDNYRTFSSLKAWIYWLFLGKDIENSNTEQTNAQVEKGPGFFQK